MDHLRKRKSEEERKKKKKRRRKETEERELDGQASSPLSHGLQIRASSSPADDAAALHKRNEQNSRKLQNQDARSGDDPAKEPFSAKKKHKEKHSGLNLEELRNHHLEDESLHERYTIEHKENHGGETYRDIVNEEGKIMKKKSKKKKRNSMDVDASLGREIQRVQEQQEEDEFTRVEKLLAENNNGERKRSTRQKGENREDQHSEEGNLLRENKKGEEKTRQKKEKKRQQEEGYEKAGTPSQKITTESSSHHDLRKEKKALKLAKENGVGGDVFEGGAVNENRKVAKKAKQTQDTLNKPDGEVGSSCHVEEDESASSKARKHLKKSRNSEVKGSNKGHHLLSNNIECSEGPSADHLKHVLNTDVTSDLHPKENEKGKKKERKRKRVTFQDQINVTDQQDIHNADSKNSMEIAEEVWGVRFTAEEDEILKDAVWKYIKSKGWDEQEGLDKVFNSLKHKDARNCWADIKLSLPHRPRQAIRYRAHLLLEKGAHAGKWSEEEEQLLKRLQGEHGRQWKKISVFLDRNRTSIKEKWRSLKRLKATGVWTQRELQQLSDMVHKCLRVKALISVESKKTDRHILRDDIHWEKIADSIGTHSHGSCCSKWYYNLQSSLVGDGLWANEDDILLLQSLLESGACAEEEVEWDSLLSCRSGQVCLMRWKQMVKQLGENRSQQFLTKLDLLARRYAPELLDSPTEEMSIGNSSMHTGKPSQ